MTERAEAAARAALAYRALADLAETVEDTLRAGRVSASAIKGTMDTMAAAGRVMGGLAAAVGLEPDPAARVDLAAVAAAGPAVAVAGST